MASHCFIPECNSMYRSKKNKLKNDPDGKIAMFSALKLSEEMYEKWKRKIPRDGFTRRDRVCEKHFWESDIIRCRETRITTGELFRVILRRPSLKPDAVPRIFPNLPKYLSDLKKPRKPPKERLPATPPTKKSSKENTPSGSGCLNISTNAPPNCNSETTVAVSKKQNSSVICSSNKKQPNNSNAIYDSPCISNVILIDSDPEETQQYDYVDLLEDLQKMKNDLPGWCWGDLKYQDKEMILCSHIDASTGLLDKYVKVKKTDLSVEGFFTNINQPLSCLPVKKIQNRMDVLRVLKLMTNLKIIFQKKVPEESDSNTIEEVVL